RSLGVRVWASYAEGAYRDIENTRQLRSDSYTVANARVTLSDPAGWSVYVFANNLFDDEYVTSVRSLVGMLGAYYGPPRMWGAGFRFQL
ncbi:MAG: TonB-dependent receptor, partial [Pseudomonadales bacterium]